MTNWADIHVISPLSVVPPIPILQPRSYRYHRADLSWSPPGLSCEYVEYPTFPLITRPFNGFTCLHRIWPRVQAARPDILLNYWLYPEGWATTIAARRLGIPSAVLSIGSDLKAIPDPFTRFFVRRTLRQASALITVSEDLRQAGIALGASPQRAHAILNGCDTSIFRPRDSAGARAGLGIPHDARLIVYVGSLIATKGLHELLAAAAAIVPQWPQLRVAFIGEGPMKSAMPGLVEAAGLGRHILLPGRANADQIAEWLAAADVFCLPSYSEGCPNVVIEAIACGRPVVATHVGGIPELVSPQNGILVPPRDSGALAQALRQSLERTWSPLEISRRFARSWEQVAADTWAVCESLLAQRP